MKIEKINYYLSWVQVIGFVLTFTIFTIYCLKEGKMAPFLIPIPFILFLPFTLIAFFEIKDKIGAESNLSLIVNITLFLFVIPALFLPVFYEIGGLIIALICLAIAGFVFYQKGITLKLLTINVIGCLVLISVFVIYIYSELQPENY